MPRHLAELAKASVESQGFAPANAKFAILGMSYLENAGIVGNSPAVVVVEELEKLGSTLSLHDPYVKAYKGYLVHQDIVAAVEGADCLIFVTAHKEYKTLELGELKPKLRTPIIVDGRNIFSRAHCEKLGFVYRGVGK
jgi:UDP-N-acetyl-D-mannosaminuronate dehydrogenase